MMNCKVSNCSIVSLCSKVTFAGRRFFVLSKENQYLFIILVSLKKHFNFDRSTSRAAEANNKADGLFPVHCT